LRPEWCQKWCQKYAKSTVTTECTLASEVYSEVLQLLISLVAQTTERATRALSGRLQQSPRLPPRERDAQLRLRSAGEPGAHSCCLLRPRSDGRLSTCQPLRTISSGIRFNGAAPTTNRPLATGLHKDAHFCVRRLYSRDEWALPITSATGTACSTADPQ